MFDLEQRLIMTIQTHSVSVSDALYKHLRRQAQATKRSVDDVVEATLRRHLPSQAEDDLPPGIKAELEAMNQLSDDVLWQIAESEMNPDKVAMYDVLLERNRQDALTAEGRAWLSRLREEADALMLRKAHAYVLLKNRGHELPTLEELKQRK